MGYPVRLFKYDLSGGMAAQMSQAMLGFHLEAIWHTSVCVYDREFFFDGGVGIANQQPRSTRFGQPMEEVSMGTTDVEPLDFAQWINDMRAKYGPGDYNLLQRNCNHFSSDALEFLVGQPVSADVATMIDRVLATPLGQMLRPSLEMMTTAPPSAAAAESAPFAPPGGNAGSASRAGQLLSVGPSNPEAERRLQQALDAISEDDDSRRGLAALEIVHRVVNNCLEHTDPKYARLNIAGAGFAPVRQCPGARDALSAIGFRADPSDADRIVLDSSVGTRDLFTFARAVVESSRDSLRELVAALEASTQ